MLCGFEFSYDEDEVIVNMNPNSASQEIIGYTKAASRWTSVYLYDSDTPTATLKALYTLGYLKEEVTP